MVSPLAVFAATGTYVLDQLVDQGLTQFENALLPYINPYTTAVALAALGGGVYAASSFKKPVAKEAEPNVHIGKRKTGSAPAKAAKRAAATNKTKGASKRVLDPDKKIYNLRPRKN